MSFLMLNVMVAIIMEVHEAVQSDDTKKMDDYRVVEVMLELFLSSIRTTKNVTTATVPT